jgi:hypothetical protein
MPYTRISRRRYYGLRGGGLGQCMNAGDVEDPTTGECVPAVNVLSPPPDISAPTPVVGSVPFGPPAPPGSVTNTAGQTVVPCPGGYYTDQNGNCQPIPSSVYSSAGVTAAQAQSGGLTAQQAQLIAQAIKSSGILASEVVASPGMVVNPNTGVVSYIGAAGAAAALPASASGAALSVAGISSSTWIVLGVVAMGALLLAKLR